MATKRARAKKGAAKGTAAGARKPAKAGKASKAGKAGKSSAAKAKAAAWEKAAAVADVAIREPTKKPKLVKALAAPPTITRPKRIHRRRFPPRVHEGQERQMFSVTQPM